MRPARRRGGWYPRPIFPLIDSESIRFGGSIGRFRRYSPDFEVEKGVGPSAAPAFPSARGRRLVMTSGWEWFEFVRASEPASLTKRWLLPRSRSKRRSLSESRLASSTIPTLLTPIHQVSPEATGHFFGTLRQINSMAALGRRNSPGAGQERAATLEEVVGTIDAAHSIDWLWGKVVAGVTLRAALNDAAEASERRLWMRFLSPLRPWVRAA